MRRPAPLRSAVVRFALTNPLQGKRCQEPVSWAWGKGSQTELSRTSSWGPLWKASRNGLLPHPLLLPDLLLLFPHSLRHAAVTRCPSEPAGLPGAPRRAVRAEASRKAAVCRVLLTCRVLCVYSLIHSLQILREAFFYDDPVLQTRHWGLVWLSTWSEDTESRGSGLRTPAESSAPSAQPVQQGEGTSVGNRPAGDNCSDPFRSGFSPQAKEKF